MKNLFAILVMICCCLFTSCDTSILKEDAPIQVSFRDSLMFKGQVLRVTNTSNTAHLSCLLTVSNDTQNQKKSYSFSLAPRQTHEIGMLEMDWGFETGESVSIKVEGYATARYKVP